MNACLPRPPSAPLSHVTCHLSPPTPAPTRYSTPATLRCLGCRLHPSDFFLRVLGVLRGERERSSPPDSAPIRYALLETRCSHASPPTPPICAPSFPYGDAHSIDVGAPPPVPCHLSLQTCPLPPAPRPRQPAPPLQLAPRYSPLRLCRSPFPVPRSLSSQLAARYSKLATAPLPFPVPSTRPPSLSLVTCHLSPRGRKVRISKMLT